MRKFNTLFLLLQLLAHMALAQEKTVTGTVTDRQGIPLPGATITIKGAAMGVSADFDGHYSIETDEDGILQFSYVGYKTQEVVVAGKTTVDVVLQEDVTALEDVVVVGFGTQKKATVSGAASFVEMDEIIKDRPVVNAAAALQGIAAGLQVTNSSGQPGSTGTDINIRGFTSINGGSPLVLIDNVPGSLSDINPRDIQSISVLKDAAASSIYGARAAFGVIIITTKGAKKNQKIKFNYDTTLSVSRASDLPEKATTRAFVEALSTFGEQNYWAGQNVEKWVQYLDQYDNDPGRLNLISDPVSGKTYPIHYDGSQYYPLADSDIIEDFLGNFGYSTIHNFGVSGGSEKMAFRINTGYSYEDGVMVTDKDNFKKYNINALLNADITDNLTSSTNVLYRSSVQTKPIARYNIAIQSRMYDPTGWFEHEDGAVLPFESPGNVVRYRTPGKKYIDNLRLFQKLVWEPLEGLSVTGEYTYQKKNTANFNVNNGQRFLTVTGFNPEFPEEYVFRNSNVKRNKTLNVYKALNLYARYNKDLGEHHFEILAGINRESQKQEYLRVGRNGLVDANTPTFELAEGEDWDISESFHDWAVVGYFGQVNYDYKRRYMLQGSLRYDGSSIFASSDRYALLPSVSGGWNIAREPFMEKIGNINMLKLRASWGKVGSQIARKYDRSDWGILDQDSNLPRDYYPFNPGYENYLARWVNLNTQRRYLTFDPAPLISSGLTWEEVATTNYGLDIGMFKNRLNASFEIYTRKTLGMLAPGAELPGVLGALAPFQNVADLKTTGWEFELGWSDQKGDFSYGINANIFDSRSRITRFDNPGGLISQYYVGRQLGEIWGYVTDGYYTADDFVEGTLNEELSGENRQLKDGVVQIQNAPVPYPGDVKYKDLNDDGVINSGNSTLYTELDENGNPVTDADGYIQSGSGDRKVIGNSSKRYQFGVNGFVKYKGFDFSFVLSGVGRQDKWRDSDLIWPWPDTFDHIYKHQLDYWTPDNQDAFYPRIYGDAGSGNLDSNYGRSRRIQTKYLSDESYLRIQNITIGYSLNSKLLEKLKINKLRIFISGDNIHTFDKLSKGMDPDQDSNGVYPIMTQYSMGLNLSF